MPGRATGVRYLDRSTREVHEVRGKAVILCAQALESTRILLNSSNRHFPNGLAVPSGALGHYLMDHISGFGANGLMSMLTSRPWIGPPRRPDVVYVPRFRNVRDRHRTARFEPGRFRVSEFKEAVKRGGWSIYLKAYGECLPRWENRVDLDLEVVDAWGIPALRISASFDANELKMGHDAANAAAEMLEAAGAREIKLQTTPDIFGNSIHDVGTTRMGSDPKKSVVNQYCQSYDIGNLFVMDGGCFVSSPCQNPTLTMMAIVCRSCAYLVDQLKKGEIY
ncbi:MAG TPA: GMC oxidoreductase [Terriglobia bacterium]|nr:GMC oxidoreductase [Terriglobia bacterium]